MFAALRINTNDEPAATLTPNMSCTMSDAFPKMPNYSSLSTQVEAIKSEITSSLAASAYSAQDLVYVAKALQALGSVVAPDGVSNITVNDNIYLGATAESWTTTACSSGVNFCFGAGLISSCFSFVLASKRSSAISFKVLSDPVP